MNLSRRIAELERENAQLRQALENGSTAPEGPEESAPAARTWDCDHDLSSHAVARYSRHLMLPTFGATAQSLLCRASVVVVGAGGLGSAVLMYLAGAGVGRLGIVDNDTVAANNLHRQIIHSEASVGEMKTESAKRACQRLNSSLVVDLFPDGITPGNAIGIIDRYDLVIDASDNAPTRYLVSDACVVTGKPLVSGAAIGTDGQLTVYNYGEDGWDWDLLATTVHQGEAGVLGPVPGVIGVLQALEAIKIISKVGCVLSKKMLIVDFLGGDFRSVKLRGKNPSCVACGKKGSLTRSNLAAYDYFAFTQQPFTESPISDTMDRLAAEERIMPVQLAQLLSTTQSPVLLLDVRPETEFRICHLKGSFNVPVSKSSGQFLQTVQELLDQAHEKDHGGERKKAPLVVVICRKGNDSQTAVVALKNGGIFGAKDLIGGLEAWREQVDPSFLQY